jgi:hypothetical protein
MDRANSILFNELSVSLQTTVERLTVSWEKSPTQSRYPSRSAQSKRIGNAGSSCSA